MTPLEQYRRAFDTITRDHAITVDVRTSMPALAASACQQTRTVTIAPIVDEGTFAIALHEAAHIVTGRCPRTEPHRPDPTAKRWHHCLECERLAWAQAMRLAPLFTRAMFVRLQHALRTYRQHTPASRATVAAAKHLASDTRYAKAIQERVERDIRVSQHEEHRRLASAPRFLRRWEIQYQEIQQIAKGVS